MTDDTLTAEDGDKTIPPTAKRAFVIYTAALTLIACLAVGAEILLPSHGPLLTLIAIIAIAGMSGGTAILGIDLTRAELEDSPELTTERDNHP